MITEVHQEGRFYRLSTRRAAQYENIKPHNPSTEDWCIPADTEEGDYLMMDPACEVNEKGTREKNEGNEVIEEGTSTPLDLDPNGVIEAEDEILPYAEEDGIFGRTGLTILHMGGRDLWMSFLVVENLDDADQFILGRDFVRNFDLMIDLNNGLINIRNPDRNYVKKPINRIITDENKDQFF